MINYYLNQFRLELTCLQPFPPPKTNLVVGGSCALQAHGLALGYTPADLDVILFNATPIQLTFIKNYAKECASYRDVIKTDNRVWEFTKGSDKMNVILADGERPYELLSFFTTHGNEYKLNSIANIIDAKVSYSHGDNKQFLRAKDMRHLMNLKNLNFNIGGLSDLPY